MSIARTAVRWQESGVDVHLHRLTVQGQAPGPTVVVTANVHGDETIGTGAVLALAEALDAGPLNGRVVLFPSLNPVGLNAGTRTFGEDGPDLNRLFPGDATGTPASRYVAFLWEQLTALHADALLDLHADSVQAIPYAIVDRPVGHRGEDKASMAGALDGLARASGLTVLRDYAERDYIRFGLDRSLAGAMVNVAGVPAVTVECGPRAALSTAAEQAMVAAVMRMLRWLGCGVAGVDVPAVAVGGTWRRCSGPRVRKSGLLRPLVTCGSEYSKGQTVALVVDLSGAIIDRVIALQSGMLVAWANQAWIQSGQAVATVARKEAT